MNELNSFKKWSSGQDLEEYVDVPPEFVSPLPPNVPERELSRYAWHAQRSELVESR